MYMPLMVDLKRAVIFGGERGEGLQKTQKLSFYADELLVVPETLPAPSEIVVPRGQPPQLNEKLLRNEERRIPVHPLAAADSDLGALVEGATFVVSDLLDEEVNRRIVEVGKKAGALVNVIDTKPLCNTWFMSLIETEHLLLGVSTKGRASFFAPILRRWLQPRIETKEKEARFWASLRSRVVKSRIKEGLSRAARSPSVFLFRLIFGSEAGVRRALKILKKEGLS